MFCSKPVDVKAIKEHRCTSCGENIIIGETYKRWSSVDETWYVNKMHQECYKAHSDLAYEYGDHEFEYVPFGYYRGSAEYC